MSAEEAPTPIETVKAGSQEVRVADKTREKLFSELFEVKPSEIAAGGSPKRETVQDIGQIHAMALPADWKAGEVRNNVAGNSSYREFNPAADKDVKVSFFYRGTPVDNACATAFHSLLAAAPHALSATEMQSVSSLLRGKDDARLFDMTSAKTTDVNGTRVLMLEGRYLENNVDMQAMLIDTNNKGSVVQEVEYQAPRDKFQQHLAKVKEAFRSIRWK